MGKNKEELFKGFLKNESHKFPSSPLSSKYREVEVVNQELINSITFSQPLLPPVWWVSLERT